MPVVSVLEQLFYHLPFTQYSVWHQEHRFHIPSQVHNLACSNRGKRRENREKGWEKDNHLFPAGKIAMTLFSFFARKSPRELSLPSHMS